jgi:hypothetical protein
MQKHPTTLQRPVVVIAGYLDPGLASTSLQLELMRACGDRSENFLGVSFPFALDFESCRAQLIRDVEKRWPSDDPYVTTEVDVVAVSMGAPGGARQATSLLCARPLKMHDARRGLQAAGEAPTMFFAARLGDVHPGITRLLVRRGKKRPETRP